MLDDELLLRVGLAASWDDLRDLTVQAAHCLGFGMASGVRIVGRLAAGTATVQSFGNPPEGFVEASKSLDLSLRDPVLGTLMSRPGFVCYSKDFYARAGAGDLADLLEPWGYRHGIGFSMHDQGEVFSFGLDSPDALPTNEVRQLQQRAMLQLLTLHARMAAKQLGGARSAADVSLTDTERDCLAWEAAGSIWRTGEVRHLSDGAVRRHADAAAQKLGVDSHRGAAIVAIRRGLIDP